ncbi:hypothetical protein BKA57DRAFT_263632 [Linnemannia elongata]|nr:hypothetical protein BKA57DRAFT_263632 [Linnemannia elongata]
MPQCFFRVHLFTVVASSCNSHPFWDSERTRVCVCRPILIAPAWVLLFVDFSFELVTRTIRKQKTFLFTIHGIDLKTHISHEMVQVLVFKSERKGRGFKLFIIQASFFHFLTLYFIHCIFPFAFTSISSIFL